MKKLNRKGFTLIELLAVIVIMAIILVVTVPNIINSISDARVNSIHNLAVSVANTYDTIAAQDLIATNKQLNTNTTASEDWECMTQEQATLLGATDVVIGTVLPGTAAAIDESKIVGTSCSAIRLNKQGGAEILLVASSDGKFNVAGSTVYALSTADTAKKK